jgi:hypothetical protein
MCPTIRVYCQARNCGTILGDVQGPVRFVALVDPNGGQGRAPDEPDGRVWLKCSNRNCRAWNVFDPMRGENAA